MTLEGGKCIGIVMGGPTIFIFAEGQSLVRSRSSQGSKVTWREMAQVHRS